MRRAIDIMVSLLALLVALPFLAVIAAAVIIDSPGNPFYLADRVGKGGRRFRMWKFRTMVKHADRSGAITGRRDPRVTSLGRLLRRTKIDELPQFINVLVGDMTLVGPRPESPEIVALYTQAQRAVLTAKPGITGKVQLESGEESDAIPETVDPSKYYVSHLMPGKIEMDLEYLRHRTAAMDAKILVATVGFVFRSIMRMQRRPAAQGSLTPRSSNE